MIDLLGKKGLFQNCMVNSNQMKVYLLHKLLICKSFNKTYGFKK